MNDQSTPATSRLLKDYISQSLIVSRSSSRAYKITSLVVAITIFALNWFIMQVTIVDQSDLSILMARPLLDTTIFLFFCHFFVRSYLKINFINRHLPLQRISNLLLFLSIIALMNFLVSFGLNEISYFSSVDYRIINSVGDQSTTSASYSNAVSWSLGIALKLASFVVWSIFYIFWHSHRSKKLLQKRMQQAQIQQLTNQLSPHFLFNTLNSIRALIYENKDKAAETVTQLSELFRTHLQAHLHAHATLEEELLVSQRYLAIEQVRLEERLKVKIQIDKELYHQQLPTLTLLTLIENATKHGISSNVEPGYINITARKIDKRNWSLTVVNSVGIKIETDGTKTGLTNVISRLHLMFGNSVMIKQLLSETEFFIRLRLPYV